jgi:cell filamentation protein
MREEPPVLVVVVLIFSLIAGPARNAYFAAIQSGMERNYQPMEKLFAEIIDRSLAA